MQQSPELEQLCDDLGATCTSIPACHILNESMMQDIDPAGDSEKDTMVNKVCTIGILYSLLHPPIPIVQAEYTITAMTILWHFELESLVLELLAEDGVHDTGCQGLNERGQLSSGT